MKIGYGYCNEIIESKDDVKCNWVVFFFFGFYIVVGIVFVKLLDDNWSVEYC